jgi:predicted acetyltransferase
VIGPDLACDEVALRLSKVTPGNYKKGWAPTHHFDILAHGTPVGKLRFRIGQSKHLRAYAGQIGYEIDEPYRGNRYATKALKAFLPHGFQYYRELYITCDVGNTPSRKTIEAVPHEYLGVSIVPKSNPMFKAGERRKRVYKLTRPHAKG